MQGTDKSFRMFLMVIHEFQKTQWKDDRNWGEVGERTELETGNDLQKLRCGMRVIGSDA